MKMKAEIYRPRDAKACLKTSRSAGQGCTDSLSVLSRGKLGRHLDL